MVAYWLRDYVDMMMTETDKRAFKNLPAFYPLQEAADLDPLLERIGNARFVLLGEASHGTQEYYTWRAEISRRLVREKGFSFIAVEGDSLENKQLIFDAQPDLKKYFEGWRGHRAIGVVCITLPGIKAITCPPDCLPVTTPFCT